MLFSCTIAHDRYAFKLSETPIHVYGVHPGRPKMDGSFNGVHVIVEGYKYKGKWIFSNPCVLGHEITHKLNQQYPELIWNPDKVGD